MRRVETDVLVVGAGGAGMMAAIAASRKGVRACIVSKGKALRSGATVMAPGALAAVDDRWKEQQDSKMLHEQDTLRGGDWLCNQELVRQTVEKIGGLVMDLERMGCMFHRTPDGKTLALRTEGGHSCYRSPYMENRTGHEMLKGLWGEAQKRRIPFYEEVMITGLDIQNGHACGAVGFHTVTGEVWLFQANAVILATGGAGELYELSDNSNDLTGDGYALALSAGAQLMDMEFVQTYPIGFLAPPQLRGVLGCYPIIAHLHNSNGERFMHRYDSRLELTTRNRLSQAIMIEVLEGRGSPLGGVYCDLTYLEKGYLKREFPALYNNYRSVGLDPEKDRFEIAPTYHFFMGGAKVDSNWQTNIPGLYSVGEAAAGVHGSNRVGQNALSEMIVSAAAAGEHSADSVRAKRTVPVSTGLAIKLEKQLDELRHSGNGMTPGNQRSRLQSIMQKGASVLRSEDSLNNAMKELVQLEKIPVKLSSTDCFCNRELLEAMENKNLLLVAKCVITAALLRRETRGAQYRHDFPKTDWENWTKNVLLEMQGGNITTSTVQVSFPYYQPEVE